MSVIETVRFNLTKGTSEETALAAWEGTLGFAKAQPGFLSRRFAIGEDGACVDEVNWTDMASAKAATAAFDPEQYPELGALMAIIDMKTMQMTHHTVKGTSD